ncbi:MAG: hypothetical protein R6X10_11805 [Desulfobacterales bacterium]
MKKQTHTNLIIRSGFALALALTMVIWFPVQSQSAEPAKVTNMTEANIMERCQEMKERRQKMMVEMKAQDAELTAQVAKMNSAPEDKKLDLIAAVITRMVEQRAVMHARKAEMQEEMMQHMGQHMQMGKESMMRCPMMKDMKDMKGMGHKSMDTKKQKK